MLSYTHKTEDITFSSWRSTTQLLRSVAGKAALMVLLGVIGSCMKPVSHMGRHKNRRRLPNARRIVKARACNPRVPAKNSLRREFEELPKAPRVRRSSSRSRSGSKSRTRNRSHGRSTDNFGRDKLQGWNYDGLYGARRTRHHNDQIFCEPFRNHVPKAEAAEPGARPSVSAINWAHVADNLDGAKKLKLLTELAEATNTIKRLTSSGTVVMRKVFKDHDAQEDRIKIGSVSNINYALETMMQNSSIYGEFSYLQFFNYKDWWKIHILLTLERHGKVVCEDKTKLKSYDAALVDKLLKKWLKICIYTYKVNLTKKDKVSSDWDLLRKFKFLKTELNTIIKIKYLDKVNGPNFLDTFLHCLSSLMDTDILESIGVATYKQDKTNWDRSKDYLFPFFKFKFEDPDAKAAKLQ